MKFAEIYNHLFAGETLAIPFDSKEEAESFRVRIHHYKKVQDDAAVGIGMMEPEELSAFSFKVAVEEGSPQVTATMFFKKKKTLKEYDVFILNSGTGSRE